MIGYPLSKVRLTDPFFFGFINPFCALKTHLAKTFGAIRSGKAFLSLLRASK
jgi:hypothetical protein